MDLLLSWKFCIFGLVLKYTKYKVASLTQAEFYMVFFIPGRRVPHLFKKL
jgi:hypothetical protein